MNNKGMAHLFLILSLPFVFSLVFSGLWMIWFINQRHKIENLCHVSLLQSQKILVDGNRDLLSHNTEALSLITLKKVLEPLRRSPNPYVMAAANAGYQVVVSRQKALAKTQKKIIAQMNSQSLLPIYSLKTQFHSTILDIASLWKTTHYRLPSFEVYPKTTKVEILIRDTASVYQRLPFHSKRQTIEARWRIPLRNFFPEWLENYVPGHNQWVGECASHPKSRGGLNWYPSIGKGSL